MTIIEIIMKKDYNICLSFAPCILPFFASYHFIPKVTPSLSPALSLFPFLPLPFPVLFLSPSNPSPLPSAVLSDRIRAFTSPYSVSLPPSLLFPLSFLPSLPLPRSSQTELVHTHPSSPSSFPSPSPSFSPTHKPENTKLNPPNPRPLCYPLLTHFDSARPLTLGYQTRPRHINPGHQNKLTALHPVKPRGYRRHLFLSRFLMPLISISCPPLLFSLSLFYLLSRFFWHRYPFPTPSSLSLSLFYLLSRFFSDASDIFPIPLLSLSLSSIFYLVFVFF